MPSVANYVSKAAPTDNYPVVHDVDMLGGYRIVADLIERDAIVSNQRKEGMLVYCIADTQTYQLGAGLTNLDWSLFTVSGGLTPTAIQTANYTANANELVLCDTSGGGFTLTLPAIPTNGMKVGILDVTNSFSDTNPLTIDPGANEILSVVDTLQVTIGRSAITFICVDNGGTLGWHILDSIPTTGDSELGVIIIARNLLGGGFATFGAEIVDNTDSFDPSTGTFTAPESGWYDVGGVLYTSATGGYVVNANINGTNDTTRMLGVTYPTNPYVTISDVRYLNQNDTYRIVIIGTTFSANSSGNISIKKVFKTANIRGNANLDYSTTETDTGTKWIDGKAIYKKVLILGSIPIGANDYPHGITGIDRVIKADVISDNGVNQFVFTGYQTTATDYVLVGDSAIRINIVSGTFPDSYAILEYTKV